MLVDALGNVIANGSTPQVFAYDAYGVPHGFNLTAALTTHLYSGEQTDQLTGLQYLRARYYNPATGTFNRLDPFAGISSDPQSLHKYAYVHLDPVNRLDPSGNTPVLLSMGLAFAQSLLVRLSWASAAITIGSGIAGGGIYWYYFDDSPVKGAIVGTELGAALTVAYARGGPGLKGWYEVMVTSIHGFFGGFTHAATEIYNYWVKQTLDEFPTEKRIQAFVEGFAATVWEREFMEFIDKRTGIEDQSIEQALLAISFSVCSNAVSEFLGMQALTTEEFVDALRKTIVLSEAAVVQSQLLDKVLGDGAPVFKPVLSAIYQSATDALVEIVGGVLEDLRASAR